MLLDRVFLCGDPNPRIFLSSFITAEVDIELLFKLFFDKINLKIID